MVWSSSGRPAFLMEISAALKRKISWLDANLAPSYIYAAADALHPRTAYAIRAAPTRFGLPRGGQFLVGIRPDAEEAQCEQWSTAGRTRCGSRRKDIPPIEHPIDAIVRVSPAAICGSDLHAGDLIFLGVRAVLKARRS